MQVLVNFDSNISFSFENLSQEVKKEIRKAYSFQNIKQFGKKLDIRTAYEVDYAEKLFILPPNMDYFQENIVKKFDNIQFIIEDSRVLAKYSQNYISNITPRPAQQIMIENMAKVDYNCIVSAPTGFGKTSLALYLTEKLAVSMLFVASRTSLIANLKKDAKGFNIPDEMLTEVNSEWAKNPIFTPIMYCTSQALSDEVVEKLYNKIGLLVADEIHLAITGEATSKAIFSINPRYRLYLSATPNNLNYIGLNQCLLSSNEVTNEENIDFNIFVKAFELTPHSNIISKYRNSTTIHERKDLIYNSEESVILEEVTNLAEYKVKSEVRGVLVYLEDIQAQEKLAEMIRAKGLSVGVLNSNTKKSEKEFIINNFDSGKFQVIVAGNSVSAGISWYRLSTIIDLNLRINANNLEQLVGRLKRKDDNICPLDKEYIKVTARYCTNLAWYKDVKALDKFDYIVQEKTQIYGESLFEDTNAMMATYYRMLKYRSQLN